MTDRVGRAVYELETDNSGITKGTAAARKEILASGAAVEKAYGQQGTAAANKLAKSQGVLARQAGELKKGILTGVGISGGLVAFSALEKGVTAVADAIGGSIDAAADFEDQLSIINTLTHLNAEDLADLGEEIEALSRESGDDVAGLTSGYYDLVSAGIDAADAMGVLEDSTVLARGALATTEEATGLLVSSLNAWKLDASESTRVMDVWAQTVADGVVTASQLSGALSTVAPIAAATGISIEEIGAALAVMTTQSTSADEATTQLSAAIAALLNPNEELARLQATLNGETFESILRNEGLAAALTAVNEAADGNTQKITAALGSIRAYRATLQITGNSAALMAEEQEKMNTAATEGGVAVGQLEERTGTYADKQRRLNAALAQLNRDAGEFLIGPAGDLLTWVTDMVSPAEEVNEELAKTTAHLQGLSEVPPPDGGPIEDFANTLGNLVEQGGRAIDIATNLDRESRRLLSSIAISGPTVERWAEAFNVSREAMLDAISIAMQAGASVEDITEQYDQAANRAAAIEHGLKRIVAAGGPAHTTLTLVADGAEAAAAAMGLTEEELARLPAATDNVTTAMRGVVSSFKDARAEFAEMAKGPDLVDKAIRNLTKQLDFWAKAQARFSREGRDDLAAEAGAHYAATKSKLDDLTLYRKAQRSARRDQREAAQQEKADIKSVSDALGISTARAKTLLKRQQGDVQATIEKYGKAEEQVDDYALAISLVPGAIRTTVSTPGLAAAMANIRAFGNAVSAAQNAAGGVYALGGALPQRRHTNVGPRQTGAVGGWRSGWTTVGEEGRELVKLPSGSYVYPTRQSEQMMGSQVVEHRHTITADGARNLRAAGYDEAGVARMLRDASAVASLRQV